MLCFLAMGDVPDKAASEFGRRGAVAGWKKRNKAERQERARAMALTRWAKRKGKNERPEKKVSS